MDDNQFDAWTRRRFGRAAGGMAALLFGLDGAMAQKGKGGKQKDKNKNKGNGKGKGKHACQGDDDCPKNQTCALDTGRCTSACDAELEPVMDFRPGAG